LRSFSLRVLIPLILLTSPVFSQNNLESPEIVDINIRGNRELGTSDLLAQLHLKEKRLFSEGSFYNIHHLAREIQKLENYYTLHGFLDATISDSLSINDKNEMTIFLFVTEGKEYYLKDINLSGNTVFSDKEYLDLIEYQVGSSFNTFKIRENLIEMVSLYRDNGYPLIQIQDSEIVDDSVSLFIKVTEGPKLNVGRINIAKTEDVPQDIIAREIIVQSGDLYNHTNIEESKRRLYETSLFNSVNIRIGKVDTSASTIDLDVEVIQAKFRAFDMNLGLKQGYADEAVNADPVLSIGLSGSWYHNNLFQRSKRIRIQTKVSSIYPSIFIPQQFKLDFYYVEPWLYHLRVPLTINPFFWYIDNRRSGFQNNAYGLRAIMTYRWFRKIKVQSLAEWSLSNSQGTPTSSEDIYEEARKIGLKLIWDERDNYFYPQSGFKVVVEPELVGYILQGANDYLQLQSSFSSYWNLFAKVVFAHNINFAMAVQKDPGVAIPYEKRFFLGGNSSIRGYRQQEIGPQVYSNNELVPAGGNFRYFTNFELRFPIYSYFGGEVFFDAGNIWSEMRLAKISEVFAAVGVGLTIKTPIGPARIDYGIPIGNGSDGKPAQTHIAIAYAF